MPKFLLISLLFMLNINVHYSQIVIDNNAPYHDINWLVNNILLGGGVTATNHSYDGDSVQIGWFNAVNTGSILLSERRIERNNCSNWRVVAFRTPGRPAHGRNEPRSNCCSA